jgi:mycothiol synthase
MEQTSVRPLQATDTDAVVQLHDRVSHVDPGIGPFPAEMWQRFVAQPGNQNGRDFRVAERDSELVGLATAADRQQADGTVRFINIIVDPAVRRQGIGSDLLASVLPSLEQTEPASLQSQVRSDWNAGLKFAAHFGFEAIEADITMRAAQLVAPRAAAGAVTFERVDEPSRYAAAITDIHNAAFRSDAAFGGAGPGEILERLRRGLKLVIATDGAKVIGYACLEVMPDATWLDGIAIDPAFQGGGIGRALTYNALRLFAGPGREFALNVSGANAGAIRMYHELGFEEVLRAHRLAARVADVRAILSRSPHRRT